MKNWLKISIFLIIYVFLILLIGTNARELLLDKEKPFPTWTYNSESAALNSLTSWDSGFYYDLAQKWYPQENPKLSKTEVQIPENSWVKIFLGTAIVGEEKFQLPTPSNEELINNMLLVVNPTNKPSNFSIYNAYEGINYCLYKGNINYERDIKSFNESLTNPKSCGEKSCDVSYISIYDTIQEKVIFQERYLKSNPNNPEILLGNSLPLYELKDEFKGLGCKTVTKESLKTESINLYEKNYTTLAFMPLYPFLVNLLSFNTIDKVLVGVLISIFSFVFSTIIIYKLTFNLTKNKEQAFFSSLIFATLPGSFFLVTFQETSLLTLIALLAIYSAHKNKIFITSLFFGLAILTNILAIFLLIPIYFILQGKIEKIATPIIFGIFVIASQAYYLFTLTGDFLTILSSRVPWYSQASSFLGGFLNYFKGFEAFRILEIIIPLTFIALMILITRKIKSGISYLSFTTMFLGISVLNAGFTGIIKFLPITLTPLAIYLYQGFKHKKLLWLVIFLGLILNLTLFIFWTVSSRLVV